MKNLKFFFKDLIGLQLIVLSLILRPVVRLKFGILYAERIGHLANTFDNYIYSRNRRKKLEFAFFHINHSISNNELLRLWKINTKKIFFSKLAKLVVHTNKKFHIGNDLIINWDEMETIPKITNYFNAYIKVDQQFLKEGEKIENIYSIKRPFICFTNRDDEYVDKSVDKNFYDYKNFVFSKFDQSINSLINKKYDIIRVTKSTSSDYKNSSKNYFFLDKNRTDFSDIFFLTQSQYNIHGSYNGITNISAIFRKKSLYLNFTPFDLKAISTISKGSIFIPKKIYSEDKKKFLKFREIANLDYDIHYDGNFFKNNGLKVVDNTEEEIFDVINEFDYNFNNRRDYLMSDLQKRFWNSFKSSKEIEFLTKKLEINISESFLKKNIDLI